MKKTDLHQVIITCHQFEKDEEEEVEERWSFNVDTLEGGWRAGEKGRHKLILTKKNVPCEKQTGKI